MSDIFVFAGKSQSLLFGVLLVAGLSGCHCTPPPSRRPSVNQDLVCRTNYSLAPEACPGELLVPECVSLDDGVTADDAVMVALWNNPAFQELLAGLELSRAQLFNAGLLPDPVLQIFYPIGPKQLEMTLYQGFTALWLRPVQKRAAERDLDQLANQLVQNGLDVIRDTRLAHADWLMAQQQREVAIQNRDLRKDLFRLAERRKEAGAISELEAVAPQLEELNAESEIARLTGDVQAARARLLFLMGLPDEGQPLVALGEKTYRVEVPPAKDLVAEALQTRPDLLAARYAMDAAQERVRLQKRQCITLDGIADSNSRGTQGFEIGPGTRFSIPIFNGNRGNIAIAEAQYQIVARRYSTVENQVRQDVLTAHARLQQASNNLKIVVNKILPATRNASELAKKNFEGGGASYVLTLQTVGQNLTAQSTQATLIADLNRALAEMERSIGHQIDLPPASEAIPTEIPPAPEPESALDQPQSSLSNLRPCRPVSHETEHFRSNPW